MAATNKFNMSASEMVRRWIVFCAALFVMAFGVAFAIRANLGTSPISSLPYVLSQIGGLTFGEFTIIVNMVIIGLQIIILRKKFKPIAFIQIPVVFLFGVMSDWTLDMLSGITYTTYWQQWIYCGIGVVVVGLGVCMEVNSRVATMAGEGLVLAICSIKTISVGNMKIIFDCSLVASAVVVSLVATHGLIGVREGTVASMLLVGTFVKIFNKPISKLAGNKD